MKNVIVNAEQVTSEWLTEILREQGILPSGKVSSVLRGEAQTTFASSVWRLEVYYSNSSPEGAPKRLFLKTTNPTLAPGEFDSEQLDKEFIFYSKIAPVMDLAFTVPCYDAVYDLETGASHFLLKDVSETHTTCLDPLIGRNCEQAMDSLAQLHAFWWDHPRLGKDIGRYPTSEEREKNLIDTEQRTVAFMEALGDQLPFAYRKTFERVLAALPNLFKRHATGRNLTLVHGDAHLGNFLFPSHAANQHSYMIDWQFWHPTIGGTDLAFMIATEWEPETRRLLEKPLLQRYYGGLLEYGVKNYAWDDCWNDYRLSVILVCIFIAVWRWSVFKWKPDITTLNRSMKAFEELNCSELLDP